MYTPHLATHVAGSPGAAGAAHGRRKRRGIMKQWRSTRDTKSYRRSRGAQQVEIVHKGVRVVHREYIETLIQQQRYRRYG